MTDSHSIKQTHFGTGFCRVTHRITLVFPTSFQSIAHLGTMIFFFSTRNHFWFASTFAFLVFHSGTSRAFSRMAFFFASVNSTIWRERSHENTQRGKVKIIKVTKLFSAHFFTNKSLVIASPCCFRFLTIALWLNELRTWGTWAWGKFSKAQKNCAFKIDLPGWHNNVQVCPQFGFNNFSHRSPHYWNISWRWYCVAVYWKIIFYRVRKNPQINFWILLFPAKTIIIAGNILSWVQHSAFWTWPIPGFSFISTIFFWINTSGPFLCAR